MSERLPTVDELIEGMNLPPIPPYRPKRTSAQVAQRHTDPLPPPPGVILQRGSEIRLNPVEWVWPGWLPRGKFALIAGQPGTGKTTIAISLAAKVTSGGAFPDGSRCEQGNVLIWSGEDDVSDTLLPRLVAAGADRARCYFVTAARVGTEILPFDPARDMRALLDAIDEIGGVNLLIVDPVVSAVTGDSHKNTEVRRALQPLVDLADETGAVVLGISHFAKGGQGQDPTQRVIGSVAFAAVARVVMVAAKVRAEGGVDTRVFARTKSNVGPDGGGFEYTLQMTQIEAGIDASHVVWGSAVDGSARELLTDPDAHQEGSGTKAVDLLRQCLAGPGWFPAKEVTKAMTDAGLTKKQIWAATKKISVSKRKGAMSDGWYWRIPGQVTSTFGSEDSLEGSTSQERESSNSSESSKIPFSLEEFEDSQKVDVKSSEIFGEEEP